MTPIDLNALDENNVVVDRQFLLFQLDFSGTALNSLTNSQEYLASLKTQGAKTNGFRFIDPEDYDDPSSPLYWRNISTDPKYQDKFGLAFDTYKKNLFSAISKGTLKLRVDPLTQLPYTNITELVGSVDGFSVKLEGMDNQVSFTINDPMNLANKTVAENDPKRNKTQLFDVFKALNPGENDVVVIKTFYGNKNNTKQPIQYFTEFIGFLTPLKKTIANGRVDKYSTTAYGLSKLFYVSKTIEQKALNNNQFLAGVEINTPGSVAVYATQFNGLNTKNIFDYLVSQTLGLIVSRGGDTNISAAIPYILDSTSFSSSTTFGFQNSLFVLLTLYCIDTFQIPTPTLTSGLSQLFPNGNLLDTSVKAILEHGEHQTFNKMVATGFENFFSQLSAPSKIFDEVRSSTFYDVFEAREGIIIARPPRYNKIEITKDELNRINLDPSNLSLYGSTGENQTRILDATKTDDNGNVTGYAFNDSADFFIRNEDLVEEISYEKNDMELESRIDTKFTWPYVGTQDFPGGHYTDGNLLIKYGLRTQGPVDNPNVQSPLLGAMFSPIALNFSNAMTRKINIAVKDTKRYRVGKIYYIEALNQVGFLTQSEITFGNNTVSKNNLTFAMIRTVVDRPISDILKSDNEVLNFGMIYFVDPNIPTDPKEAAKTRSTLLSTAKTALQTLANNAGGGNITIPMFRYLPTILDLIVDIEVDPSKSKRQYSKDQSVSDHQAQKINEFTDAPVLSGTCCATNFSPSGILSDSRGKSREIIKFLNDSTPSVHSSPTKNAYLATPPAGLSPYLFGNGQGDVWTSAQFVDRVTHGPLLSFTSPFTPKLLAKSPNNFKMSQALLNKMSAFDFNTKFNTENFPAYPPQLDTNLSGFPQLYDLYGSSPLFGNIGNYTPQDYLNSSYTFSNLLVGLPNTLKLDVSGGHISNNFFDLLFEGIPGVFRLPYGHLLYQTKDGKLNLLRVKGRYRFVDQGLGEFRISPFDGGATLTPEDGKNVSSKSSIRVTTTSGVYFISPYTDLSPQRMIELGYDPALVGFRTNLDTGTVFSKATQTFKNSEGAGHTKGNAIDLCPDYVVGSSESLLRLLPAFYPRFEGLLEKYFKHEITPQGVIPLRIIQNAITIHPSVASDSSAVIPSFNAPIYHCEVTPEENRAYAQSVRYYGENNNPKPSVGDVFWTAEGLESDIAIYGVVGTLLG